MADEAAVRFWRPSRRRRALGFLAVLPFSFLLVLAFLSGFNNEGEGQPVALIVVLLVFNIFAILANFREWVRVSDTEVAVQTSLARLKRVPREKVREIRAGRRLVQLVGVDELPFVTFDRGVYSDAQLLEMAETLQIAVRGPRRPRRLGLFEGTQRPVS